MPVGGLIQTKLFFFSSRRRHTRSLCDWSSDVCSSDLKIDLWVVDHIVDFPQCAVSIYDDKGVKVFSAKPYGNDWNGTFNGKNLPDGVYFYVIRCDGEENSPRTGSITLIR